MMRVFSTIIIILALLPITACAQKMITDLRGFRLGQYREAPRNVLGEPLNVNRFQERFENQIFLIKPDTSVYMIFEYAPEHAAFIWSIQLKGSSYETDFMGFKLGMDHSKVRDALGRPTRKIDIGEYGQKWEYDGTNYSVEINTKGKLSGIKITDESLTLFPKPDVSQIPAFGEVASILQSHDAARIMTLLCSNMAVLQNGADFTFKSSIDNEVRKDVSGIFKLIESLSAGLDKINIRNTDEYEENIRAVQGQDPMHVIKIKKGSKIKEIVFKYQFGKYLIWEIVSE